MEITYIQQEKGHLSLCVCSNYKNQYFFEIKKQIEKYLNVFEKANVTHLKVIQSNISESCYIDLNFKNLNKVCSLRISSHISSNYNDYEFIIDKVNSIKNEFHFNKLIIELIKR